MTEYDPFTIPAPLPVMPHTHTCLNMGAGCGRTWTCHTQGCIISAMASTCPQCNPPGPHQDRCRCGHCPPRLPSAA
jgi:hypothetical protein